MATVYTVREFRKSLKEAFNKTIGGEKVIVQRGSKYFFLTCGEIDLKDVKNSPESIELKSKEEYGCGCKKEAGKLLCPKHGRL